MTRIVFMGTPIYAAVALDALFQQGYDILLVVTQPDRPSGRGKAVKASPVKEVAKKYGLPVYQPEKIKEANSVSILKEYDADFFVVAAFGQILSKEVLSIPKFGCLNIHASILPKYRGAAPISKVILDGETETGITIMQMDQGIDTGDIWLIERLPILPEDTGGSLHDKLAALGAQAITKAIPAILTGELVRIKQEETSSSYAGMLSKSSGRICWSKQGTEIERMIRALDPWPGAFTSDGSRIIKIWKARIPSREDLGQQATIETQEYAPGEIVKDTNHLYVQTGEGILEILELQAEGKKRMTAQEFLRGHQIERMLTDEC